MVRKTFIIVVFGLMLLLSGCQKKDVSVTNSSQALPETNLSNLEVNTEKEELIFDLYDSLYSAYNDMVKIYNCDEFSDDELNEKFSQARELILKFKEIDIMQLSEADIANLESEISESLEWLTSEELLNRIYLLQTESDPEPFILVTDDTWKKLEKTKSDLLSMLSFDLSGKDSLLVTGATDYLSTLQNIVRDNITEEVAESIIAQLEAYIYNLS